MGGLTIVSTYIFWNHHEEIEGQWDWSGNKDLRRFIELCGKERLMVILRIGPFSHGEVRNGGFPDWLFGRPFDLRSNDEAYLSYVRRFFGQIGNQVRGLLWKDGGPIVGCQIENEYEHASAPWEVSPNATEWTPVGNGGTVHMITLKRLAREAGLDVPFYTATAWGGACAPVGEVFPLWGGYAYRPWIFYGDITTHPATTEYLFEDFHNNAAPDYYNFDPSYQKETLPFACCEMGGGMTVFYKYRFKLPYESVSAMALVKVASGCNFLGYYMYHGGTNPRGHVTPYLNENAVPKFSYDYQAPIGEFGQLRESYKKLKLQHYFYRSFESDFCRTKTVLPAPDSRPTDQYDISTLRYALRVGPNGNGWLFLNNFQDHVELHDQKEFSVTIEVLKKRIRIPACGPMSLAAGESCLIPFAFSIGAAKLRYACAQIITKAEDMTGLIYFFFVPRLLSGEICFEKDSIVDISAEGGLLEEREGLVFIHPQMDKTCLIRVVDTEDKVFRLCLLTEEDALNFWSFDLNGKQTALVTHGALLIKEGRIDLEYRGLARDIIKVLSPLKPYINGRAIEYIGTEGPFSLYAFKAGTESRQAKWTDMSSLPTGAEEVLKRPVVGSPVTSIRTVNARAVLNFNEKDFEGLKDLILGIDYRGDVGYAFIDGVMVHDNFCNDNLWEIALVRFKKGLIKTGMYLYVSPFKKGKYIKSDSRWRHDTKSR